MNACTVHTTSRSWQRVWSPGFSRSRALNTRGAEHFEDSGVRSVLPAKAGTPYPVFGSRLCALLLLLIVSFPFRVEAQTNGPAAPLSSNRFLLILDTSRDMQGRADGTLQAMQELLASGMGGQLRRGDTIGVWTFNEEHKAGQFPLQRWSPETHRSVGMRILNFLRDQKYEKRANIDKVLPEMERVIKDSEFITVI